MLLNVNAAILEVHLRSSQLPLHQGPADLSWMACQTQLPWGMAELASGFQDAKKLFQNSV